MKCPGVGLTLYAHPGQKRKAAELPLTIHCQPPGKVSQQQQRKAPSTECLEVPRTPMQHLSSWQSFQANGNLKLFTPSASIQ